jgi:hypothetical protein
MCLVIVVSASMGKSTLTIVCAGAAIYAVYLPVALWLGRQYTPVPRPPGEIVVALNKINRVEGVAFGSPARALLRFEDDQPADQQSPVMVYEDLTPLGPGHSRHHEIEYDGHGRFSHWKGIGILFSTSDNSDPNTNGRKYWAVLPKR